MSEQESHIDRYTAEAKRLFAGLHSQLPRRALGRAITLLESTRSEDRLVADRLVDLARTDTETSQTFRVAISGTPGVGKSTFIEAFGQEVIQRGHRLAVLAVDPSSGVGGGSILGDKTRMETLSRHEDVFIRPSPNAGHSGGVGAATRSAILLCEAAGYDYIIVETVGVGQAEWRAHSMTDAFVLLAQPAAGDELQGIKRGILELADCLFVNKGDQLPDAAQRAALELRRGLHLAPPRADGWTVKTEVVSALRGDGIPEVYTLLAAYREQMTRRKLLEQRRSRQEVVWLRERLEGELLHRFSRYLEQYPWLSDESTRIPDQYKSLSSAVDVMLADFIQSFKLH